jgi:hypothetical protein
MHRPLLIVGGVLNTVLALFHVILGWQIHRLQNISAGHRALMEMLNSGGALMIVFFAVASFVCVGDVLTTRLGKLFLGLVFAVYFSRAIEEIVIATHFSAVILAVCLLIAAVYLALLVTPAARRQAAAPTGASHPA